MNESKASSQKANLSYLAHVPQTGPPSGGYPLLLFLHGRGERGDDLERVKTHGPAKYAAKGLKEFPFVVVSPQCGASSDWAHRGGDLRALIDEVAAHYPINKDRIYGTGMSMGAAGIWSMLETYPDLFAAVVLVSPYGSAAKAASHKDVPTWIFLREGDPEVSPATTRSLLQALVKVGSHTAEASSVAEGRASSATVKLTSYVAVPAQEPNWKRHDAWTETFAEDGLYDWLGEQARKAKPNPTT